MVLVERAVVARALLVYVQCAILVWHSRAQAIRETEIWSGWALHLA
jgi:hypothetical protein